MKKTFLCSIFLFISCSEIERDNPDDPGSKYYRGGVSSSSTPSSSSVAPSSNSTEVSSSSEQPSSASSPSSSSEAVVPSSPNAALYTLTCTVKKSTGTAGTRLNEADVLELKCTEIANPSHVTLLDPVEDVDRMTGNPVWRTPQAGVYDNIQVKIDKGNECKGLEVKCAGTITITAPSSSSRPSVPSSSSAYVPPTTPSSSSRASTTTSSSSGGACGSDGKGDNCLWNAGGDCWPLNSSDRDNCGKNAWIFQGGTEGKGTACSGGTFICGKDSSPPTGTASSLGCCKWETETKCWDVYTEKEKEECSGDENRFWSQSCPNKDGGCPN